jgi:hypothetical protein
MTGWLGLSCCVGTGLAFLQATTESELAERVLVCAMHRAFRQNRQSVCLAVGKQFYLQLKDGRILILEVYNRNPVKPI